MACNVRPGNVYALSGRHCDNSIAKPEEIVQEYPEANFAMPYVKLTRFSTINIHYWF